MKILHPYFIRIQAGKRKHSSLILKLHFDNFWRFFLSYFLGLWVVWMNVIFGTPEMTRPERRAMPSMSPLPKITPTNVCKYFTLLLLLVTHKGKTQILHLNHLTAWFIFGLRLITYIVLEIVAQSIRRQRLGDSLVSWRPYTFIACCPLDFQFCFI